MLALESVIAWMIIGAVAGWLAGVLVNGYGFGLIGNIIVGFSAQGSPEFWLPLLVSIRSQPSHPLCLR
jgi:hypothetical protein